MRTTVKAPDGGEIVVEHPEGASDEQIIAYAQANYKPTPPSSSLPKAIDYDPGIGMGEATAALGSGMVAAPAGGIAGLAGSVLPGPAGQGADWSQRVSSALTYSPRTAAGKAITGVATKPFELLAEGADKVGGAVTDATGSPAAGTAANTIIQAVPMAVSKVVPKGASALKPVGNAATEAGFKVTPQEGGAGIVQKNVASAAGEPRLARGLTEENTVKVHEKIAKDFGLEEGEVLTRDKLEQIREKNGAAYEKLRKAGKVEIDEQFKGDLGEIVKERKAAGEDFPRGKDPMMEVHDRLTQNADGSPKTSFNANSAVSEIKNLRKDAQKAFRSGDNELGKANLQAAEALENILDRHVEKLSTGNEYVAPELRMDPKAVGEFKKARQQIAKTYEAEKALVADGRLDPQVYARLLKNGRKLSGGSLEVAEAATAAPRSLAKPTTQATGISFADLGMGAVQSLKTGGLALPALLARPATRGIMSSDLYQSGITRGGILDALTSEAGGKALPLSAYEGLTGNQSLNEMKKRAAKRSTLDALTR